MTLACAGCTTVARLDGPAPAMLPPPAPAPIAEPAGPAAPRAQLPATLAGTWISGDGTAFLAIADDQLVVNLPGLPRRAARVAAVVVVGGAAEVTLDDGATLVLVSGRATGERTVGGLTLTADRAVLDVGVGGSSAAATVRLWGEGQTTWLPLAAAPMAKPMAATADERLLAAAEASAEPLLAVAVQDVLQSARRGAAVADLDATWGEHARRLRLAALDRLDAQVGSSAPDAFADADRLVAALAQCSEAYAAWRAERG